MMGALKKYGIDWLLFGVLIASFFFINSTLSLHSFQNGVPLFNSPDETANYFFSKQFALNGKLSYVEPLSKASNGYVHPRSMTAVGDSISPVGFLGLPVLYGSLARIIGVDAIPFFTPLLASLTAIFFYVLVRAIFSHSVAVAATILFLIHPVYLYNANRAMLPNVPFIDLLIIGCAFVVIAVKMKRIVWASFLGMLSGMFIGAALWVRFSEAPWVVGILFFCWLINIRKVHVLILAAFAVGMALLLGLMAYFNASVYGNPLLFGYQTSVIPQAVFQIENSRTLFQSLIHGNFQSALQQGLSVAKALKHAMLPFGIQPQIFTKVFYDYGVFMFLPFSVLAFFGFFFACRDAFLQLIWKKKSDRCLWIVSYFTLSAWLVVFYGSWVFYDNLNKEVTIGTSYLRYWLPLFIFSLPFGGFLLTYLHERARGIALKAVVVSMCCSLALFSFHHVFTGSVESVDAVANEISLYHAKREFIMRYTPDDAVVVSARSDKIFFPVRKVAEQTSDFREIELMKNTMSQVPVYYYGLWNQKDAESVSKKYFLPQGLMLQFVADVNDREHLYKLITVQ